MVRKLCIVGLMVAALLVLMTTRASAAEGNTRAYAGLLGAGASWHSSLAEHFDWGLKVEG